MSQKLSVNGLKWVKDLSKFNELFIKSYNEESDVRNFFFWCSIAWKFKWSWYWFNDFTCKNENWKKKKKKKSYYWFIWQDWICYPHKKFKTSTKSWGLVLKEIHKIIKFKQNYTYKIIHMNTKLRKKAKNDFEKNFFKLMNNSVFGKTMKFMVKQSKDVEKKFDTSNYELERPLLIGKKKKVVILIKSELGGKIMKEFVGLRAKHIAL